MNMKQVISVSNNTEYSIANPNFSWNIYKPYQNAATMKQNLR